MGLSGLELAPPPLFGGPKGNQEETKLYFAGVQPQKEDTAKSIGTSFGGNQLRFG